MPDELQLSPATPEDLVNALSFALRFEDAAGFTMLMIPWPGSLPTGSCAIWKSPALW